MKEKEQIEEIYKEVLHTRKGYEYTMMSSPMTGTELVIRESFERRRLVEDDETEEEHKMRKKLLNMFKKSTEKNREVMFHDSSKKGTYKK
jgi:saccharopine dehydrogenase-like NADP-dependent oxidoreductase|tara:strand:+ start:5202 stop:5471 length:270 start_codon:yes stop_codon:yes gene_type:complete